ncbi:MAG: hypothetical protein A2Y02_03525 [Omnitrophica bacterium GWA2_52_12]|nr:MAG: hypothetical protein A2Y02_03525 [Omnitrophica bacterium GWA2_52_12]
MNFPFTRHHLSRKEAFLQRLFEILPGALSWTILLGMVALSALNPILAALVIIAFDVYWILRISYVIIFLILAYAWLEVEKKTNWMERVQGLANVQAHLETLQRQPSKKGLKRRLSRWTHQKELRHLLDSRSEHLSPEDVHHLVIMPVASEKMEILRAGLESLRSGDYPSTRMVVVIALEEWAEPKIKDGIAELMDLFRGAFMDLRVVVHPSEIPGEARVKGANITWAARDSADYLSRRGIPFDHVIVSCFDADTVVSASYFSCLTYNFLICPQRQRASFQPIPVYHNNIWDVPSFAKVLETSSSFFILAETTNPEKLVTFSSHSMSFKALVEIGYWPVDMISDDSLIFWKALLHYEGDYRTVPMYVTLSMDVIDAGSWWKTAHSIYKQKRRWAWGVEGFPIIMRGFLAMKDQPLRKKLPHIIKMLEGHIMWATWSFMLMVIGWLPALFASRVYSNSVVYYSAARISTIIFSLSYLNLFILILLGLALLPRKDVRYGFLKRLLFILQWFLLPWTNLFFAAIPALDAQTRLMFGKYMEFWVADKRRVD